jgi:protein MpaA
VGGAGRLWRRHAGRQAAGAPLRRAFEIGRTVLGRPIEAYQLDPPSYARPRAPALLFGAIHGDEPLGTDCLTRLCAELAAQPPGRPTTVVPALNVDGLVAGTKNNANDVDLNRNFAAASWEAAHAAGYFPGDRPESEPETQALAKLIDDTGARRLVALHSPYRMCNWDGGGRPLAEAMAAENGYPATASIGYPTPGSFGAKYGVDRGLEVVTLEIPFLDEEEAWAQNRTALRLVVDLPP